jgi:release factor family 2
VNLAPLQSLYDHPGPFLSVQLDRSRTTRDAARLLAARWEAVRADAITVGADEATVSAIERALTDDVHEGGERGRLLVSAGGAVRLDETLDTPPKRDVARWWPLPDLLPLVAQAGRRLPYAVVVADRTGADITVHTSAGDVRTEVEGQDYPIRKVAPGGWSQRRYQQRVENVWEQNAREVARHIDGVVRAHRPRVVMVAGEVRARALLREQLAEPVRDLLVDVEEGGRAAGASEESLQAAIDRVVAERAEEEIRSIIETYREEIGQRDRAVEGLDATVAALRQGSVAALLVRPDLANGEVWAGGEPLQIALSEAQVAAMGADQPFRVSAGAAAIRAAAATAADAWCVEEPGVPLRDGFAALLRYRAAPS